MANEGSIGQAARRLNGAMDALEAAIGRQQTAAKTRQALEQELQTVAKDRSRLAQELDRMKQRHARLEKAADNASDRIDTAMGEIADILENGR